jgi:hypothetical protein
MNQTASDLLWQPHPWRGNLRLGTKQPLNHVLALHVKTYNGDDEREVIASILLLLAKSQKSVWEANSMFGLLDKKMRSDLILYLTLAAVLGSRHVIIPSSIELLLIALSVTHFVEPTRSAEKDWMTRSDLHVGLFHAGRVHS